MKLGYFMLFFIALILMVSCAAPAPAPLPKPAPAPLPAEAPKTHPEEAEENLIRDLAYMKAACKLYSDDADPEWEGSEISLLFYDSKSDLIFSTKFKHITLHVTIEVLAREEPFEDFTECVYKGESQVTFPFDIRIPFEHTNADPQTHLPLGIANIVVHTPQQGDFSIEHTDHPRYGEIHIYPPEED